LGIYPPEQQRKAAWNQGGGGISLGLRVENWYYEAREVIEMGEERWKLKRDLQ